MKDDIKIILGSHNHVPYGSSDEEFENAYNSKLKPFITTLYKYPHIPAVLHYSGVILYWIERYHPEFFMIIEDMISRKQVEFLGGGFYEPMMPLIPLADKIGQIEMLTTYLRKQFGKRPQGCWLPGLSWEQGMVSALSTSGMGFTFLDEDQFRFAGVERLDYPCITEDMGKIITVFPIAGGYSAGFARKKAKDVLDAIISGGDEGGNASRIITVFPESFYDGEDHSEAIEFSMHEFFEDLSQRSDFITFSSPSRLIKGFSRLEKAYFPGSSERRFMYWAMDRKNRKKYKDPGTDHTDSPVFYDGALSKQFLVQYPEANGIYSKMMYTSLLISQLRGDKSRKLTAREELWKSQGYDAFCHIGDGGIYRSCIRKAAYKALLEAERITREKGDFISSLAAFDFDLDGEPEYLFQDKHINCYVKSPGAGIFELDYLPKAWNYLDTFARRQESYIEEPEIEDGYRRSAFLDRLVPGSVTFQDARRSNFGQGRFCALEPYTLIGMDRLHQEAKFKLHANRDVPFGDIEIEKYYHLKKDSINLAYTLSNRGEEPESFQFITEIDLSFPGESEKFQRIFTLGEPEKNPVSINKGGLKHIQGLELQDIKNEVVINLSLGTPSDVWVMPVRTRCRINGEITDQYQSTCIMPVQPVTLKPGESYKTTFKLRFHH